MKKVAILGCGFMGGTHAGVYEALSDRVQVVAVADVRREKAEELAAKFGAKVYGEAMELLENASADYIDICLPTYLHCRYAVAALKKGFHVFVEKPLCLTREETDLLLKTQKETGRLAQVGQVIRFWDEYVYLKGIKDSGIYGKVIGGRFSRLSPRPTWAWDGWLHDAERSGGMALDFHIHDADFIRYLMGDPQQVRSSVSYEAGKAAEYIMTDYVYGNTLLTAEGCWDFPADFPFSATYWVKFEKATVVYNEKGVTVYEQGGKAFTPEMKTQFNGENTADGNIASLGGYYNEIKYFLSRLDDPTLPDIASLEEGAASLSMVLREIEGA